MTLYGCHATCPWECIWQCGRQCSTWHHFLWKTTPVHVHYEWLRKNVPGQSDTVKEKLTSCDTQKNRKTNIIKQLKGTKHNVLPLPNKSWLGYGPCRITVSHYQAAARRLTAHNRAKAFLWSHMGKPELWNEILEGCEIISWASTDREHWWWSGSVVLPHTVCERGVCKSCMAQLESDMMKSISSPHTHKA